MNEEYCDVRVTVAATLLDADHRPAGILFV